MLFSEQRVPYRQTAAFSTIVIDYIGQSANLQPFMSQAPTIDGIKEAIQQKKKRPVDRQLLVSALKKQYATVPPSQPVQQHIALLADDATFTVCTAHQPNLFTGPLYFIYKILHTVKLAAHLRTELPEYHFVPVYYMGSEDADLQELNHITVEGKIYRWDTDQQGAVGRMVVDDKLIGLIAELQQQIGVAPNGQEMIELLQQCYSKGTTIQQATFKIVHALFSNYGVLVLIADDADLKRTMLPVFRDDVFTQGPSRLVEHTSQQLQQLYHSQAHPRAINLFYLKDAIRERIIPTEKGFAVQHTAIQFTAETLQAELEEHPERFSPNVILRGLYQETLLPNIAFIGGGGELAYWLQLKDLFTHYAIPFPVLVLRNSFLILNKKEVAKLQKLGIKEEDLFLPQNELLNRLVQKATTHKLTLDGSLSQSETLFATIKEQATQIDTSLSAHVEALKVGLLHKLKELEKKMLRAEKRKFEAEKIAVDYLKQQLFPHNGLQERVENIAGFYAKWGSEFIAALYRHSLALEQEFVILKEV